MIPHTPMLDHRLRIDIVDQRGISLPSEWTAQFDDTQLCECVCVFDFQNRLTSDIRVCFLQILPVRYMLGDVKALVQINLSRSSRSCADDRRTCRDIVQIINGCVDLRSRNLDEIGRSAFFATCLWSCHQLTCKGSGSHWNGPPDSTTLCLMCDSTLQGFNIGSRHDKQICLCSTMVIGIVESFYIFDDTFCNLKLVGSE